MSNNRSVRVGVHSELFDDRFGRIVEQDIGFWSDWGDYLTTDDEIKIILKTAKRAIETGVAGKIEMWSFIRGENDEDALWQGNVTFARHDEEDDKRVYTLTLRYRHEETEVRESTDWKDLVRYAVRDCLMIRA